MKSKFVYRGDVLNVIKIDYKFLLLVISLRVIVFLVHFMRNKIKFSQRLFANSFKTLRPICTEILDLV